MERVRIRTHLVALAAVVAIVAAPLFAPAAAPSDGVWLAGDFHVHTTYSHDSWDPVNDDEESEFYTLGYHVDDEFRLASMRGLDFLAITDHNDIRSQSDPGFGSYGVLGIHAYENSLSGHAQMLGAQSCYAPEGPFAGVQNCNNFPNKTPARINQMADMLRADGGVFQINHPAAGSLRYPDDMDWGMGYDVVPDTVEVWNIQSFWQAPAFSSDSNDDAIRFWEGWLDRGYHVTATAGSDSHWVSTSAIQGVGQPTTWVFAADRSEDAVLDALRAGRTAISWQPPGMAGPRVYLEADVDGDGVYESMQGDTVPANVPMRARVEGAPPGAFVRIHAQGPIFVAQETPGGAITDFAVADTDYVWLDLVMPDHNDTLITQGAAATCDDQLGEQTTYCRNRLARLAMTSAMYVAS